MVCVREIWLAAVEKDQIDFGANIQREWKWFLIELDEDDDDSDRPR